MMVMTGTSETSGSATPGSSDFRSAMTTVSSNGNAEGQSSTLSSISTNEVSSTTVLSTSTEGTSSGTLVMSLASQAAQMRSSTPPATVTDKLESGILTGASTGISGTATTSLQVETSSVQSGISVPETAIKGTSRTGLVITASGSEAMSTRSSVVLPGVQTTTLVATTTSTNAPVMPTSAGGVSTTTGLGAENARTGTPSQGKKSEGSTMSVSGQSQLATSQTGSVQSTTLDSASTQYLKTLPGPSKSLMTSDFGSKSVETGSVVATRTRTFEVITVTGSSARPSERHRTSSTKVNDEYAEPDGQDPDTPSSDIRHTTNNLHLSKNPPRITRTRDLD